MSTFRVYLSSKKKNQTKNKQSIELVKMLTNSYCVLSHATRLHKKNISWFEGNNIYYVRSHTTHLHKNIVGLIANQCLMCTFTR